MCKGPPRTTQLALIPNKWLTNSASRTGRRPTEAPSAGGTAQRLSSAAVIFASKACARRPPPPVALTVPRSSAATHSGRGSLLDGDARKHEQTARHDGPFRQPSFRKRRHPWLESLDSQNPGCAKLESAPTLGALFTLRSVLGGMSVPSLDGFAPTAA